MKLAIIGSKGLPATYGGTQVAVENIAENLVKLGCDVTVFSRKYYSCDKRSKFTYKGIRVLNLYSIKSKRLDIISHTLIASIIAAFGSYDIVVYHGVPFFAFIPKIFKKRVFFHSHGFGLYNQGKSTKWNKIDTIVNYILEKLHVPLFDGISTVSYVQRLELQNIYKRDIKLIENGLNFAERKILKILERDNYFLFVGRIVPEKGIEVLIDSFNEFCEFDQSMTLKIVGDEIYTNNFMQKMKYKANHNVEFLGVKTKNDLIELYQKALCVIVPSLSESFGLVLIESLYYNGAVIASSIPQFKYLAGEYIYYFQTGNKSDLLRALLLAKKKYQIFENYIRKSYSYDFNKYDWKLIAQQYLDFYKGME